MKHYGDITKINGADVEPVDIITGGSPCQDLSVAGKRAGLAGERSGLFMEQIRIIKEMRAADEVRQLRSGRTDEHIRPRFMVWENVPGAFSSNDGEDFRAVLEEVVRVKDQAAVIPRPTNGKWTPSGCILGDGWSVAWRVHDAQFWGVPQRRKRIALVADFSGGGAPEILFERKGLPGDITESREARKEIAGDIGTDASQTISFQERSGKPGGGKGILIQRERTGALSTLNNQAVLYRGGQVNEALTLSETCRTLNTLHDPMKVLTPCEGVDLYNQTTTGDISKSLNSAATDADHVPCVCYGLDRASFNQGANAQYDFSIEEELAQTVLAKGPGGGISEKVGALCAADAKGVGNQYVNDGKIIVCNRRSPHAESK